MSALNQAFLRAYAKQPGSGVALPIARPLPSTGPGSHRIDVAHAVPEPYRNESLQPQELPSEPVPFVPAWEVDQFPCPSCCAMAWEVAGRELNALGQRLARLRHDGVRVLGVTSQSRQEGRTTLSICLARAAADQGLRVMLLDADLDQPQLAASLGVDVQQDWTEVLSGGLPLDEVAVASLAESLTLLPLLPGAAGRGNLLRLGQFALFVDQLTTLSDLVVVDLPPLESHGLPVTRAGFASPVDAVVVVRDVRRMAARQLADSVDELTRYGLAVVGVIENFA